MRDARNGRDGVLRGTLSTVATVATVAGGKTGVEILSTHLSRATLFHGSPQGCKGLLHPSPEGDGVLAYPSEAFRERAATE